MTNQHSVVAGTLVAASIVVAVASGQQNQGNPFDGVELTTVPVAGNVHMVMRPGGGLRAAVALRVCIDCRVRHCLVLPGRERRTVLVNPSSRTDSTIEADHYMVKYRREQYVNKLSVKILESGNGFPLPQRDPGCGAVRLCDLDSRGTLTLVCEPCCRRGRYRVASLIKKYGPRVGLPDIRHVLADRGECRRSTSPPRPCHSLFKCLSSN